MQHDAHELIRLLIDRLERDMKVSKVNAGLVSALYEGDLANQVRFTVRVGYRLDVYASSTLFINKLHFCSRACLFFGVFFCFSCSLFGTRFVFHVCSLSRRNQGTLFVCSHRSIRCRRPGCQRFYRLTLWYYCCSAAAVASAALKVKCLHCGHVSERREKYRDVLLQVAGQEDLVSFESCFWGVGYVFDVSWGYGALGVLKLGLS